MAAKGTRKPPALSPSREITGDDPIFGCLIIYSTKFIRDRRSRRLHGLHRRVTTSN